MYVKRMCKTVTVV